MVVRVRVDLGKPDDLFGINHLSVYNRRHLHVRSAGIKADPASVHITAYRLGRGFALGLFAVRTVENFKFVFIHIRHGLYIEILCSASSVKRRQPFKYAGVSADNYFISAGRPQHELQNSFRIPAIVLKMLLVAIDLRVVYAHISVFPVNGNRKGFFGVLFKGLHVQPHRNKFRFQHR